VRGQELEIADKIEVHRPMLELDKADHFSEIPLLAIAPGKKWQRCWISSKAGKPFPLVERKIIEGHRAETLAFDA
jgi:hypothetical protein